GRREPSRRRAARAHQPAPLDRGRAAQPPLRPRSVQPEGVHARRERRRELRRSAHTRVRGDDESRHGTRDRPERRHHRASRRQSGGWRGLRPHRRLCRIRGHARSRHRDHGQAHAATGRQAHDPRGVPDDGPGVCLGLRDHRLGSRARSHRAHGPARDAGGRGRGRRGLSARRGRHPALRGRRPARRARRARVAHRGDLPRERRDDAAARADRARAREAVGGTQGRVRRDGTPRARVLRAGRRDPPDPPARRAAHCLRSFQAARAAHRERVPCRRRQPPPARALLGHARTRTRPRGGTGDPHRLRRGWRITDGRTRRRDGEELLYAAAVPRGGPRVHAAREDRVRSRRSCQSGQDLSHPQSLPRVPAARDAMSLDRNETATVERLRPADARTCADILRRAGEARQTVRVRGGGTKDYLGDPRPTDLVLETTSLGGIVEHVPADLTVTVGAGTRFRELEDALARAGQMLALDPPHADAATIGGIVAANSSGFRRARYGGVRDLLIGTRCALVDGTVASAGGRVVKNVAGYDVNKLLIGSFGTLAVITECTFKVTPLPVATAGLRARFRRAADAYAAADLVARTPARPAALAIDGRARDAWELVVLAEGEPAAVDRAIAIAADAASARGRAERGDVTAALTALRE